MVNLLVDLDERRFGADALSAAMRGIETAGYRPHNHAAVECDIELLPAWLDETFGGTWGSEAAASQNVVAYAEDGFAGFASYDARGLRFRWLRGLATHPGVGIFGPFGVAPEHRKSGIGPHLLTVALASLRSLGYTRALIPAVGEEKLVAYYERHAGARVVESFEKASFRTPHVRTVVLASGSGTNFQAVADASRDGRLPLDVAALVCNRADAFVLERARDAEVGARTVVWDRVAESRAEYDARLLEAVTSEGPELVLLLGWMHLFDEGFVRRFGDRAINIHPAYLPLDQNEDRVILPDTEDQPAFRGAFAVRDALREGAAWIGATSHLLSLAADRGRVLARKAVRLPEGADEEAAMAVLRPVEQQVVASGIMRWVFER